MSRILAAETALAARHESPRSASGRPLGGQVGPPSPTAAARPRVHLREYMIAASTYLCNTWYLVLSYSAAQ